jgi:hypothetical protein
MVQVLGVEVEPIGMKEPVLDVPAIDMTDAAKPQAAPASAPQPKRAAGAKTARRKARKAPVSKRVRPARAKTASANRPPSRTAKTDQLKRTRDGSVGRDTFEQVEALLKQGKNKTEAFKQVAADTGKNSGTVAANYYRVARDAGAVKPRKVLAKAPPSTARRGRQKTAQSVRRPSDSRSGNTAQGGVDQILSQVLANVQALTEAVKAQDAEVRELQGRLDRAGRLLG